MGRFSVKKSFAALCLALGLVILAGCAASPSILPQSAPAETAEPVVAAETPEAAEATPSPTPGPTATPEPTPVPTPTPVPDTTPTPEPPTMSFEDVDALLRQNGALCGVAYLGESPDALNIGSPALLATGGYNWRYPFLGNSGSIALIEWKGSQVYAVIPRSDVTLTAYEFYMNKDYSFTDGLGQYIQTAATGQCAILRCAESLTMPNLILLIDSPEGQCRYIPRVNLGENKLLTDDSRVMDLTIYDFQFNF